MGSFFVAAAFAYTGSSIAYVSVQWIGQHFCAWEPTIKVQAESVAIKLGHPILDVMHKTCCLYKDAPVYAQANYHSNWCRVA